MTFRWFLTIFFTCTVVFSFAQPFQTVRVEIEMENDKGEYSVVPAGENGVVMYHLSEERVPERNKVKWNLSGYNNQFVEKWKSAYVIGENYGIRQHYYHDGFLYLLFARYNREQVIMAIIDVATGKIKSVGTSLPRKFVISNFRVFNNIAYINGNQNKKGALGFLDLKSGELTMAQLHFDDLSAF
jgi:hypothetical protein